MNTVRVRSVLGGDCFAALRAARNDKRRAGSTCHCEGVAARAERGLPDRSNLLFGRKEFLRGMVLLTGEIASPQGAE
ncbi:hypothetical protein A6A03_07895 [Chloroflexus islandicus]|uniref:Uncharacterized protein n=1 Tax=Chloroflexus islandicus TaxID=1707952 RepID=A0A178MKC6_9CHLR|nr:hypothetical protein A6A03_07895 [Chloroflexus islandicus]